MYYDTTTYLQLKEQRKHKLFIYTMLLALVLLLVNITMDYMLTGNIALNAIVAIFPITTFLLIKQFTSLEQVVFRSFYLFFIIIIVEAILHSRPEQGTITYWAYLIIVIIFTYEKTVKSAFIINSFVFLNLATLALLNNLAIISLPYSTFNYYSFLMIYIVLSLFVFIMVKNYAEMERILHRQSRTLQISVDELQQVQKNLIEAEKMAALGGLVAGISHEINTPLGIALTAITHNQDHLFTIEAHLQDKTLKQTTLVESIKAQQKGYRLILRNLDQANNLIGNFKQIAVDQASENLREIYIYEYIQETIDSMKPLFKQKSIQLHVFGEEQVKVDTYPGPIYQIISNFINNSLVHGFESQDTGNITISVQVANQSVTLSYADDGVGMSEEMLKRIYDPYVTSKGNQGGSGLGMNIVYNLVTQVLEGKIDCQSRLGEGIQVTISFPVKVCN